MIAVADGGSTKIDWVWISPHGGAEKYLTSGANPFLLSPLEITNLLLEGFGEESAPWRVEKVFFYGAGCSDEKRCAIMASGLQGVFSKAEIYVEHDLLGAARALCGTAAGIACILGTGSNSCHYDGQRVIDNVPSLGYVAGDEGSGYDIGKRLLQAFFYREMPNDLAAEFEARYASDKQEVWDRMYGRQANVFFASLSKFADEHRRHPYVVDLLKKSFSNFLQRHVLKYKGADHLPVHFVGSIAWHFRDILSDVLEDLNLLKGRFLQKPIDALVEFHLIPSQST